MAHVIDLNAIAARLEGLEETIISKLIERAQWKVNKVVYQPGQSGFCGETTKSLFAIRLQFQEEMDARFGRFCVPEERPFSTSLPSPQRLVNLPDTGLHLDDFCKVSLSKDVLQSYLSLIPRICIEGDDGQYGSSVEHDVYAVQAIARRVHFGALYVAESKYQSDPHGYEALIRIKDTQSLYEKLTRKEVEDKILQRIRDKVNTAQAGVNLVVRHKIDPEPVVNYYRDQVIPLTKQGEILYLLNRSGA